MTIEQLPTFNVHRVEGGSAFGSFDRELWMGERYLGDLLIADSRFVCGRFVSVDVPRMTATFVPTMASELTLLKSGETYRRFDGYWGERAALVLDRHRCWNQRTFEPVDAVAFQRPGGTLVGNATNQNMPEGGTLIRGGWDHEHCEICSKTISPKTDPIAMVSEPDHWICQECYENFVVPGSLAFIYVEEFRQPAGEE
jgi:hypothetical protein